MKSINGLTTKLDRFFSPFRVCSWMNHQNIQSQTMANWVETIWTVQEANNRNVNHLTEPFRLQRDAASSSWSSAESIALIDTFRCNFGCISEATRKDDIADRSGHNSQPITIKSAAKNAGPMHTHLRPKLDADTWPLTYFGTDDSRGVGCHARMSYTHTHTLALNRNQKDKTTFPAASFGRFEISR